MARENQVESAHCTYNGSDIEVREGRCNDTSCPYWSEGVTVRVGRRKGFRPWVANCSGLTAAKSRHRRL